MTHSIFSAPPPDAEPAERLAFVGNRLQRRSEYRKPDCLEQALAHPHAQAFAFLDGGHILVRSDGEKRRALFPVAALGSLGPDFENAVVLGFRPDETPVLGVALSVAADDLPDGYASLPMRALYMQAVLSAEELAEAAQAAALVNWSHNARHCGRCGCVTLGEIGGYRRRCPTENGGCGAISFPRTDPVVIMLALDEEGDRCLLGRSPHFLPGVYSCLAGFLEPGETMEEAVRRETQEESGITIGRVRYHANQPWPMPHTLMLGFYAEAVDFKIVRDEAELEDCRWFTRDEARRLLERRPGELTTAAEGAIASLLLRDWVARG